VSPRVPRHHSLLRRATRFSAKQFRSSLGSVKRSAERILSVGSFNTFLKVFLERARIGCRDWTLSFFAIGWF
jgi:hypothetical protein